MLNAEYGIINILSSRAMQASRGMIQASNENIYNLIMYLFVFIGKWKLLAHLRTEELVHMADNRDARLWCNAQV